MPLAIFDLDNTLVDRAGLVRRWVESFMAEHALGPGEADWLEGADGDGFTPRLAFMAAVRERYRLAASPDELVHRFREQLVALVEPDPRVPALLDEVRAAGWRIAIATNGTTRQQLAKIDRSGLRPHVDAIAVSEEVGAAKPDRRVFEAAAARCGMRLTDGGWMVGDCATRDIGGGQAVGLRTVWLCRGRAWDPAKRVPDAIVDGLSAAVAVLLRTR